MQTRQLGPFTISAIGLGAMPLSMSLSLSLNKDRVHPSGQEAIATVHAGAETSTSIIDPARASELGMSRDEIARCSASHGPQ
ncbi:MAG TPA: hypothetical protein VFP34_17570 [Microlunatus sp.]|nr:hypothetical protein [Microlunatus sp.]